MESAKGSCKPNHLEERMPHGKITKKLAHFCKHTCPVCTRAREKGKGVLYTVVRLEEELCPACRSYKKVYGKKAHEK
jgi:hypothetical protein